MNAKSATEEAHRILAIPLSTHPPHLLPLELRYTNSLACKQRYPSMPMLYWREVAE